MRTIQTLIQTPLRYVKSTLSIQATNSSKSRQTLTLSDQPPGKYTLVMPLIFQLDSFSMLLLCHKKGIFLPRLWVTLHSWRSIKCCSRYELVSAKCFAGL